MTAQPRAPWPSDPARATDTISSVKQPAGSRTPAFIALTIAGCIWGTGFIFGKLALEQMSVGHMNLYRFLFASVGFLAVVLWHPVRVQRADWLKLSVAAILGVPIQFLVQVEGLSRTTVSHASLMVGTAPVVLAVSAFVIFRERMHWSGWTAILVSTVGVALIVLNPVAATPGVGQSPSMIGDLLVMGSLVAGVAWILINKELMTRYPPLTISAYVVLLGTAMMTAWVLATEGMPPVALSASMWTMLVVLGVCTTTVTTLLWNWGLSRIPAGQAGVFLNLEPVVGTILGVTILHDTLGVFTIVGGLMIVVAAIIVSVYGD